MKEACKNNGLPEIIYKIKPNTAKNFRGTLCGAQSQHKENIINTPILSKFYKDQQRNKSNKKNSNKQEQIGKGSRQLPNQRIDIIPVEIRIEIQADEAKDMLTEQVINHVDTITIMNEKKQTLDEKLWNKFEKELEKSVQKLRTIIQIVMQNKVTNKI